MANNYYCQNLSSGNDATEYILTTTQPVSWGLGSIFFYIQWAFISTNFRKQKGNIAVIGFILLVSTGILTFPALLPELDLVSDILAIKV